MRGWMPILADVAASLAAYAAVLVLVALVLVAGIAKCWSISRRPTTNTKCVISLALVLIAWLVSVGGNGMLHLFPLPDLVFQAVAMVSFGLSMAAVVLAALGLSEYARGRGRYTQGKAQAIWALVVSGLEIAFMIAFIVEVRWGVLGRRGPPTGARVVVFDDLNFKFYAPGGRWVEVQTNSLDRNATLALMCARPEVHFLVIAQKAPNKDYSTDDLAELATKNLLNSVEPGRVVYRGPTRRDRLEGLRIHSVAPQSGQQLYFEHRLFVTNGWAYQLVAWGRQRDQARVAEEADYLARRFDLLDYGRHPPTSTNATGGMDSPPKSER